MQSVLVSNKKVNREWQRRKNAIKALRKSTGKYIPFPKFPDIVNEYIIKGFMFDSLQSSTTKKILTNKSRPIISGELIEERKKCPMGKN